MISDTEFIKKVHRHLLAIAEQASWSPDPAPEQPFGHYTDAFLDAKRALNITDITDANVDALWYETLNRTLERLMLHFVTYVDVQVGQRKEALSQIRMALLQIREHLNATQQSARGIRINKGGFIDWSSGHGDASHE